MRESHLTLEHYTDSGDSRSGGSILPDERLAILVRDGSREAFEELHRRFAPVIHGFLLSKMPADDVADVQQEVFLAAHRSIGRLREPKAVGPWLIQIARNHVVEYYRRRRPVDELTDGHQGPHDRSAEAREVMRAIRSLPDAYSETLTLRLVEGMSGQEIAEATGLKPESVRVNLHRGMEMLRQKLGIGGDANGE